MEKVLITGGTGTVGLSFIKRYLKNYIFFNYSRNEKNIFEFSKKFPNVESIIGDIVDFSHLLKTFQEIKPDIVIHTAALKHADLGESHQTEFIRTNVIGSYNIVRASILTGVKIITGISTDKASNPKNVYGYTKKLMEEMFIDSYSTINKFVCTRFANVAGSNGSVIPFWKKLSQEGQRLKLTDPEMNRLMISQQDCAELIQKAIDLAKEKNESFILSKKIKSINLLKLAKIMSDKEVEIIGKRPGEQLNEILIDYNEIKKTEVLDDYFIISKEKKHNQTLQQEYSSLNAEKATDEEISKLLSEI